MQDGEPVSGPLLSLPAAQALSQQIETRQLNS